eukprot:scaffold30577_cov29-Tisochrysis_lutea.AAC.2
MGGIGAFDFRDGTRRNATRGQGQVEGASTHRPQSPQGLRTLGWYQMKATELMAYEQLLAAMDYQS